MMAEIRDCLREKKNDIMKGKNYKWTFLDSNVIMLHLLLRDAFFLVFASYMMKRITEIIVMRISSPQNIYII
jgi:hypothetical protein